MENKTIYIVTVGEYSGYTIDSVWDDEALAEKHAATLRNANQLERYELNAYADFYKKGYFFFLVDMDKEGHAKNVICQKEAGSPYSYLSPWFNDERLEIPVLIVGCFAKDEQHAIKITNEKRLQLIANNQWIVSNNQ